MHTFFLEALGTKIGCSIENPEDEKKIRQEIFRIEKKFSRFEKTSVLNVLCQNSGGTLDDETLFLWQKAEEYFALSEGIFDVGVGKILADWGYGNKNLSLKNFQTNTNDNENFSFSKVERKGNVVKIPKNFQLDFGGFGKGYALDSCAVQMRSDRFFLNFGGDIVLKNFPQKIGLQSPFEAEKIVGFVEMENGVLCASGGYARTFFGKHHLVLPSKKISANACAGVFVKGKNAMDADAFATTLFVQPNLEILGDFELEGCCIFEDFSCVQTPNFGGNFF